MMFRFTVFFLSFISGGSCIYQEMTLIHSEELCILRGNSVNEFNTTLTCSRPSQ